VRDHLAGPPVCGNCASGPACAQTDGDEGGDGPGRLDAPGNDRGIHGLASGNPYVFPGSLFWSGPGGLEIDQQDQEMDAGPPINVVGSRNAFWALPEHGSGCALVSLAQVVEGLGARSLRRDLRDILVDVGSQCGPSDLTPGQCEVDSRDEWPARSAHSRTGM